MRNNFLKSLDSFSTPIPSFNLRGDGRVRTYVGGLSTLLVAFVTFIYGLQKLLDLFERQNPTINTIVNKNVIANEERFSVVDQNFMMAFAVENYFSSETLEDSTYLKWAAVYTSNNNGK